MNEEKLKWRSVTDQDRYDEPSINVPSRRTRSSPNISSATDLLNRSQPEKEVARSRMDTFLSVLHSLYFVLFVTGAFVLAVGRFPEHAWSIGAASMLLLTTFGVTSLIIRYARRRWQKLMMASLVENRLARIEPEDYSLTKQSMLDTYRRKVSNLEERLAENHKRRSKARLEHQQLILDAAAMKKLASGKRGLLSWWRSQDETDALRENFQKDISARLKELKKTIADTSAEIEADERELAKVRPFFERLRETLGGEQASLNILALGMGGSGKSALIAALLRGGEAKGLPDPSLKTTQLRGYTLRREIEWTEPGDDGQGQVKQSNIVTLNIFDSAGSNPSDAMRLMRSGAWQIDAILLVVDLFPCAASFGQVVGPSEKIDQAHVGQQLDCWSEQYLSAWAALAEGRPVHWYLFINKIDLLK